MEEETRLLKEKLSEPPMIEKESKKTDERKTRTGVIRKNRRKERHVKRKTKKFKNTFSGMLDDHM